MGGLLTLGALLLLLVATSLGLGTPEPVSLALVLAALALTLAASCLRWSAQLEAVGQRLLRPALAAVVGWEAVLLVVVPPALETCPAASLAAFRGLATLVGLAVLGHAFGALPGRRWRFPLLLALYGCLGAWVLLTMPAPPIDVLLFQERASDLLVRGRNPYQAEYPNLYDGGGPYYGEGVLRNGAVQSFPYPPLSLLLVVPGRLAGDVRWSHLAALVAAAALLAAAGRSLAPAERCRVELAVLAFLLQPGGLTVLQVGWTEPLVMAAVGLYAWAVAGGRRGAAGLSLGCVLAAKQYTALWAPVLWACRCAGRRSALAGVATALLLALPFLLWDPAALWRGVVRFHLEQPFRPDALSVPAAVWALTGTRLPAALGFAAAAGALWLVGRRAPRQLTYAARGGAAVFLSFFAFNTQAFLNYYWFSASLLAVALVTLPGGRASPAATRSTNP
jgi:uncharacterized membrane protein